MSRLALALSGLALATLTAVTGVAATTASAAVHPDGSLEAPASAARAPLATTSYVAATHSGHTAKLQLISRSSGMATATLATAPMVTRWNSESNPFGEATIAPDGTVWAVRFGSGLYDATLLKISGGHVAEFMPYVNAVRVSPDGARIAVSVLSPDVNHDGLGTASVRVGAVTGGTFTTIEEKTFPVNQAGEPTIQIGQPMVSTWLGNHSIAVSHGCCGMRSVTVLNADAAAPVQGPLPYLGGDSTTDVIAKSADDAAIVPKAVDVQAPDGVWSVSGYDLYRVTPATPTGVKVGHVDAGADGIAALKRYVTQVGATPQYVWATTLNYRPVTGVTMDWQFIAR